MRKNEPQIRADILTAKYDCTQIAKRNSVDKGTVSKVFEEMIKTREIAKDHFIEEKRGRYFTSELSMMKDPVYTTSGLIGQELQMFKDGTPPGYEFR